MATRERPYPQFNFLVDLGDNVSAGFQECSNLGMEVGVSEYRNGNELQNHVRKITGLNKATDVTLKRGIIGITVLYDWLNDIREGVQDNTLRTVSITLLAENRDPVLTWSLQQARIIKYVSGPFNAKGNDVAMEELTLAYERMELVRGS